MITLNKKLKKDSSETTEAPPAISANQKASSEMIKLLNPNLNNNIKRVSIRDRLLIKDVQEMEQNLPASCKINFPDPNILSEFSLLISPEEGFWKDGKFKFNIYVPEEYNMQPPLVRCDTKLWHPNISVDGEICLSLLRTNSIDGLGWAPTRRLKDVIWGLNSLFTDLLNFDDPLNSEASDEYTADKKRFMLKVREFIYLYARR